MPTRNSLSAALIASVAIASVACEGASTKPPQASPSAQTAPADPADSFRRDTPALIDKYLEEHPVRKLQIGSGSSRLKGWLNTDIEPGTGGLAFLDATKRFPFEDGELHYIFSEHVIEHLSYDEGKFMVAEAYRVLAPGGKMRISTPDLARFIALFDKDPGEEARAYIVGKLAWREWPKDPNPAAIILNLQMSSWGHKFMYDVETLGAMLSRAGFRNLQEFEENISGDEHLRDLEARDTGVNKRWSDYETMSIEVEKPRATTEIRER
jgi:predicted SAM-dependent methyltransferase